METTRWLNITNYGVVVIKKGEVSLAELEQELSEIFLQKVVVADKRTHSV
jgi:hypothetical protein